MERKVNEYLRDFPILQTKMNGRPIVYLDNGATTQKPETVIRAVADYCTYCNANPHRGAYELSIKATDIYERARVRTQQFIGAARPEEVVFTKNATEALNLVAYSYGLANVHEGDEIVITISEHHSNIVPWQFVAKSRGAVLKYIYLGEDGNLSEADIAEKITERTKLLVLPFPNNPTGAIMEEEDLRALLPLIEEHDLFVLTDEIYSELSYRGRSRSIIEFPGMRERTVYINGFSKAYAMTGWRLGYACAPERILSQMLKLHQFALMCAPTCSQYAAVEALRNGREDVARMRQAYDARRRFLVANLRRIGMDCFEPYGAFYVFPSIRRFHMTSEDFANRLLREEKVAIIPGNAFGACGEGYMRISYAYSIQDLERIEGFVSRL